MTEWKKYEGTHEQIAELRNAKEGVCLMFEHSKESFIYSLKDISTVDGVPTLSNTVTHYLICNPRPHAKMIKQWAQTGQPVWIRECRSPGAKTRSFVYETYNPDWNIPGAEYSFTPFVD